MSVVERQKSLLSALSRDFWAYAAMILDPDTKTALESECRKAGARPPGRLSPAGDAGPDPFLLVVSLAHRRCGGAFVRHAGFYCGSNAARHFEANVRHPTEGARRLTDAFSAECPGLNFEAEPKSEGTLEVALLGKDPFPPAVTSFASGFVKGAATRLNEGDRPQILEKTAAGGKAWTATIGWEREPAPPAPRVTGGRRTRRR